MTITMLNREKLTRLLLSDKFDHYLLELRLDMLLSAFKQGSNATPIAERIAEMLIPEDEYNEPLILRAMADSHERKQTLPS